MRNDNSVTIKPKFRLVENEENNFWGTSLGGDPLLSEKDCQAIGHVWITLLIGANGYALKRQCMNCLKKEDSLWA